MQYPHRRYLLFLLSKRYTPFEVISDCTARGLLPPNDQAIAQLQRDLGAIPSCWRAELKANNTPFRRWLRDLDLIALWRPDADTAAAFDFLNVAQVRKDFEALLLMHGSVSDARKALRGKYPEHYVPQEAVLSRFVEFFWDIGAMTADGLFTFLRANADRQELLAAAQGDLATTYAQLGLRQRIEGVSFLDNLIALADHQVELARRTGAPLSGAKLAGLAALARQGMDAVEVRSELLNTGGVTDDLRRQAMAFKARKSPAVPIPSFDDVVRGHIEAEYEEVAEDDNVHQLTRRSG